MAQVKLRMLVLQVKGSERDFKVYPLTHDENALDVAKALAHDTYTIGLNQSCEFTFDVVDVDTGAATERGTFRLEH